ncbi:MAG: pyrimidine 5'-nucleotidase [Paracoccaceae bacterium]
MRSLAHVDTWIFDLDRTLYPVDAGLLEQMGPLMERFIADLLGVDAAEAARLRDLYWREHGTTLSGLIARHGIDPVAYIDATHAVDLTALRPDPDLRAALTALPGRRVVHTNGAQAYAERVLDALALRDLFEAVHGVEASGHVSKPDAAAHAALVETHRIDPTRAAMVEDDPRNLTVPHALGMVTILVGDALGGPQVDHRTDDLAAFLRDAI